MGQPFLKFEIGDVHHGEQVSVVNFGQMQRASFRLGRWDSAQLHQSFADPEILFRLRLLSRGWLTSGCCGFDRARAGTSSGHDHGHAQHEPEQPGILAADEKDPNGSAQDRGLTTQSPAPPATAEPRAMARFLVLPAEKKSSSQKGPDTPRIAGRPISAAISR